MRFGPVLIGGILLMIVIAASTAIAVRLIDINAYRASIARALSAVVGADVTIEGNLRIDLALRPHLRAEGVTLTAVGGGPEASSARIGQLNLDLDPRALVRGLVEISGLSCRDVDVVLTRNDGPDGRPAWQGRGDTPRPREDGPLAVHIERVRAENVRVTYRNGIPGRSIPAAFSHVTVDDVAYSDTLDIALAGSIADIPVDFLVEIGGDLTAAVAPPHPIALTGTVLDMHTTVAGTIDDPWNLRGFDVEILASASDLHALASRLERELPPVGPVTIAATLSDNHGDGPLAVDGLAVEIGNEAEALVAITGHVKNVSELQEVDIRARLQASDLRQLAPLVSDAAPETGPIAGSLHLHDGGGILGIDELALHGGREDTLLVDVTGSFGDLRDLDAIDLRTELTAADLSMIGALFASDLPALGPLALSGRIDGSADHVEIENLAARLGETRFSGEAFGSFVPGKRPHITAHLESPRIRLADFGIAPSSGTAGTAPAVVPDSTPEKTDDTGNLAGSSGLSRLNAVDARVSLRTDRLEGRGGFQADQFYGALVIEDGRLVAWPIEVVHPGGTFTARAEVDARAVPPTFSVEARARGLDVALLLAQVQDEPGFSGTAELSMQLDGQGHSAAEVAADLEGRLDLVIRDGTVAASQLDFFARSGQLDWLFSNLDTERAEVNCLVATVDVDGGAARARKLLLDAPHLLVEGGGTYDFKDATIDLRLVPKPKVAHFRQVAVPIDLRGPIRSPDIVASTLEPAATDAAGALDRLKELSLPVLGLGKKDPCVVLVRSEGAGATSR